MSVNELSELKREIDHHLGDEVAPDAEAVFDPKKPSPVRLIERSGAHETPGRSIACENATDSFQHREGL